MVWRRTSPQILINVADPARAHRFFFFYPSVQMRPFFVHNTEPVMLAATVAWVGVLYHQWRQFSRRIEQCTCLLRDIKGLVTNLASVAPTLKASSQTNTPSEQSDYVNVRYYDDSIRLKSLESTRAVDLLIGEQSKVRLSDTDTLCSALNLLYNNRSITASVYDDNNAFCGVLEALDVVRGVLGSHLQRGSVRRLLRQCVMAGPGSTVKDIMSHLRRGVRHVALAQLDDSIEVLTQRRVLECLLRQEDEDVSDILKTTLVTHDIGTKNPIFCTDKSTAREAFETMAAYSVTSLPIVRGTDSEACGVISATDVLYAHKAPDRLDSPVVQFVSESRADASISRETHTIVSCSPSDSVDDVLHKMLHEHVHHVYILDCGNTPVGVVSFVDILRLV